MSLKQTKYAQSEIVVALETIRDFSASPRSRVLDVISHRTGRSRYGALNLYRKAKSGKLGAQSPNPVIV